MNNNIQKASVLKDDRSQGQQLYQQYQYQVDQVRKEGDELKVQASFLKKELEELKVKRISLYSNAIDILKTDLSWQDQVRTLELELGPSSSSLSSPSNGEGTQDRDNAGTGNTQMQLLNDRLEKSIVQCHEAQEIKTTYEQIIKRLKVTRKKKAEKEERKEEKVEGRKGGIKGDSINTMIIYITQLFLHC